jgi:isoleucyl-tRNA synthetase
MAYKVFKGLNLPDIDNEILKFWDDEKIFEKSIEQRSADKPFVFYEGPPSANGHPGIHHVMGRTIKDIFCRFHSMQGKRVERKGGWDTHGLPIELSVEKELGITKEDIGKKISVDEYNIACKKTVMRFKEEWDDITRKQGYWVDLENPYITYENNYIESVWNILSILYKKDYLYKGYTIQPYSPAAGTGLSTHELNMPGAYKDVRDTSIVAQFKILDLQRLPFKAPEDTFFLAWTTTPWTLPGNCGLTVGAKIDYVAIQTYNQYTHLPITVILAKALQGKYFPEKNAELPFDAYKDGDKNIPFKVIAEGMKGADFLGIKYEQLMPYVQPNGKAFEVILGDFVTTEDGTGIVHTASLFGSDDFRVCNENGIAAPMVKDENDVWVPIVNKQGRFVKEITDFALEPVKEDYITDAEKAAEAIKQGRDKYLNVDERISIKLKGENRAFKVEKYMHSYPHCWRTDKPILYYPLDSWFIRASRAKERMYELNKTINWKPEATGTGRFGKWLENLQDWNLSRSRYWGIPLPIWRTEDGKTEIMIGSLAQLQTEIDKANKSLGKNQTLPADIHRPYIDEITLVSDKGEPMKRELDLIDVWFDSGSMPYAQWHYPFENQDKFKQNFPADFIAEGVDQTRGWFYTLHAIAVMAFDSVAFKNVVSNGLVLDKNGQKMSKRLGNGVDPFDTIKTFGADATRWYMISNAQPWDNLKFDVSGIGEVRNKFFGTLYNTYSFFALYANVDGFTYAEKNISLSHRPEIDQWILSLLNTLIIEVEKDYAEYEPTNAARKIQSFVDEHLSNWYVRLCRRRFWKGEYATDKIAAYQTLYECLTTISKLSAPIAPFFSDWLYIRLHESTNLENHQSVHLADFPKVNKKAINKDLEQRMNYAQRISSLILSIRKKEKLRVRQPLQKALLPIIDASFIAQVEGVKDLILAETNVKHFEYITDTNGVVTKKIKPNFKTLGKTLGGNMKAAGEVIESLSQAEIASIEKTKQYQLVANGVTYDLTIDDFLITSEDIPGWQVASDGDVTVALDISLNDDLIAEGTARDLVNRIQNIRKEANFDLTDRVNVTIERHPSIIEAVNKYADYIKAETLANSLQLADSVNTEKMELNDEVSLAFEVLKA